MKRVFLFLIILIPELVLAQWTTVNGFHAGRKDDIFFVNDSTAYAAAGSTGRIGKSVDAGNSWTTVYTDSNYLRSIEFIDEAVGFCGTLDSGLLMTADSGNTWINIANSISPVPKGVCGLSIPNDSIIYGCGIFNSPAFFIKSADRGNTWTYTDMSVYATALVDIHFLSADTGFAAGRANPQTDGGVILYTTDGGTSWQILFKTLNNLDYVWKIQSPDGKHYFGSVSSLPGSNTSFLHSSNRGLNWTKSVVDTAWHDIQMIGFIDSLTGWTAGSDDLFSTVDGGNTWLLDSTSIPGARYFNRFLKLNDSTAFASGGRIYKYTKNNVVTSFETIEDVEETHLISINPNPTRNLRFDVEIGNRTNAMIQLINLNGQVEEEFFMGEISKGKHSFNSKKEFRPQSMFLVIRTNEGLFTEKVIFE